MVPVRTPQALFFGIDVPSVYLYKTRGRALPPPIIDGKIGRWVDARVPVTMDGRMTLPGLWAAAGGNTCTEMARF